MKKKIGYQVFSKDGTLHLRMKNDQSIYSYSQAIDMAMEDRDNYEIRVVYGGDIENPVKMFDGEPL